MTSWRRIGALSNLTRDILDALDSPFGVELDEATNRPRLSRYTIILSPNTMALLQGYCGPIPQSGRGGNNEDQPSPCPPNKNKEGVKGSWPEPQGEATTSSTRSLLHTASTLRPLQRAP